MPIHPTPEPQPPLPEPITKTDKSTSPIEVIDPRRAVEQKWKQAIAFSNASDWPEATTAWKQFIHDYSGRDRPTDQEAYQRLGIAYEGLHNWSEAAEAFKQASLADDQTNNTKNLMRLGHCYIQLSRWKDAEEAYKKVLKIEPGNKQARQSLVWAVNHE
ncbi:MAG TPA: tetratricopeptide repeat protein [Thermoanaerobaculia bacterium]|nr:tetratricopeptide repeat protein [Thermoanaerobaculia bacterium]